MPVWMVTSGLRNHKVTGSYERTCTASATLENRLFPLFHQVHGDPAQHRQHSHARDQQ